MKSKFMNIDKKQIIGGIALTVLILFMVAINLMTRSTFSVNEEDKYMYLSDIPYVSEKTSVGWGSLTVDRNLDANANDGLITLIIDGKKKSFLKGISAHAPSNVVYEVGKYGYDYLTTYVGVDAGRGNNGNGVKIHIFTSQDGENWDLETPNSPALSKGDSEAIFYKVDIRGKKYIKLYANHLGNNTADHAVYANAKLIKADYEESEEEAKVDFIKTVEELDKEIKALGTTSLSEELEKKILQRKLVSSMGYEKLQMYATFNEEYKETIEWLYTDIGNLRYYILGGKPTGSYMNSLRELNKLYQAYKNDFKVTTKSKYGTVKGDLYKRMAIALSLTHSAQVSLWMQPSHPANQSESVTRYAIFKKFYDEGKLKVNDNIDITKWFENYEVEEMRFVMNNIIDDESIEWLHDYTQSQIEAHPTSAWSYLTPHPYMAYVWPNYGNAVFHDPLRKDYWDKKYNGVFSKYGVTYSTANDKVYKVWMNFRNEFGTGAVCGGISKTGSNIRTSHGIPAAVIGQPGHAAIIYYSQDDKGNGYWNLDNDVSGWTLSEKGERMLLGWGNPSTTPYSKGYTIVYMVLAQEVINNFDKFQKSEEQVMMAESYKGNLAKQEEIYRKALKELPINIDAWYGLINTYNANENKSEDEYYELAREIGEALKYYPLPMQQLTDLIKPKMKSVANQYKFTLMQTRILTEGSKTPNNTAESYTVYQPSVTRTEANYLLGRLDKTIATFSFDGEDANKIVLADRFNGNGVRWDYSIDGKKTWKEVSFTAEEEHKWLLSNKEISAITAEKDIYIHIVGVNYNEENLYKIDITKGSVPATYFANDLENRVVGVSLTAEWRMQGTSTWTSYASKSPDLTGNKIVEVRIGATGTSLASDTVTYTFTEDNQPNTRKYIPVSHLTKEAVSTEAVSNGGSAVNAIDGNYNTRYHSAWNGTDTERYITIKLDNPVYLSAVEFVPAGGGNGRIVDGTVYGSMDGKTWIKLSELKNQSYPSQANTNEQAIAMTKKFEIANPREVQYVKIVADRTNGNWFAARAFNFYQDITKNPHPTAGVGYSTTEPTNKEVVARLINPSTDIVITNNGGKNTYTFTKNGEFTFTFKDKKTGVTGSAKAKVDWIDTTAPTAKVKYSTTSKTNHEVVAELTDISEEITVINNNGKTTYTFAANGKFTFEIQDKAGNVSKVETKVDWIDTTLPTAEIVYDISTLTNKNVTATLSNPSEKIKILNNNGKSSYIFNRNGSFDFKIQDEAGNVNTITAVVGWIDKIAPTAKIEYSTVKKTKNPVTATIKEFSEEATIINNGGKNTYTFTSNGSFTFEIQDEAGNIGKIVAKVNWIDDNAIIIPPRPTTTTTKKTTTKKTTSQKTTNKIDVTNTTNNAGGTNTTIKTTNSSKKTTTKGQNSTTSASSKTTSNAITTSRVIVENNEEKEKKSKNKLWLYIILGIILVILLILFCIARKKQK
ncbi:MAG: NPCBM/NEW2 domain-containing protein [Bacilli bacterium]|nr:NPCBM/NEW2 domain-containing protein [Bacilli bacterium]